MKLLALLICFAGIASAETLALVCSEDTTTCDNAVAAFQATGEFSSVVGFDTTTGTLKLRAQFDNRDTSLFPNQFVNTRLLVTTEHGVVLIPSSAIQHNGQTSFVYVINNGVAKVANVKPGTTDHGVTAVEGINAGDELATSSFERLQSGSKVIISKQPLAQENPESNAP